MSIQPAMDDAAEPALAPAKAELVTLPPYKVGMWVTVMVPGEDWLAGRVKRVEGRLITVRELYGHRTWTLVADSTVLPFGRRKGPRRSSLRRLIRKWLRS